MTPGAAPDHPNPAPAPAPGLDPGVDPGVPYQIAADAYHHLIRTLRLALPRPPGANPTPEDFTRRDHAAIAGIAALAPGNAVEAELAAQFAAASEHWKEGLRPAEATDATAELVAKCRGIPNGPPNHLATRRGAQALAMMRQSTSALRLLLRVQEARRKLEADNAACDRAARAAHIATVLMAEALAANPHPNPLPGGEGRCAALPLPPGEGRGEGETARAAVPQAQVLEPQPEPQPSEAEPSEAPAEAGADPTCPGPRSAIAAAEEYAAIYPERAALIRRLGRVPDDSTFGPPDDDLVRALVAARTPASAALDRTFAHLGGGRGCPVRACPGESRGHGAPA